MKRLLVAGLLLVAAITGQARNTTELDRVVAVVNDDVITQQELNQRTQYIISQLQKNKTPIPPHDVLTRQILERLVMDRIQIQLATKGGLRVEEGDIDHVIDNIAKENKLTLDQLRQTIQKDGMDYADFRRNIGNEILISRLRQREINNRVTVTPQEIENYLSSSSNAQLDTEYHLAHIIIAVPESATPAQVQAAKDEAGKVLFQLRAGADFGQMAVTYSGGQHALEGGDLGWRRGGELPGPFLDAISGLKEGQVSDVIRSPSGFHIFKLLGVRGGQQHVVRQIHVRHILIRTNALVSDQDAKTKLQRLRDRILHGEDFGQLARANSDDKGSASNGGDLGWVSPGQMVPEFEQVMNDTPVGQLSQPFHTAFGWHILQPLAARNYDDTEEYRRTRAAEALRQRKIAEATENWLRQIRDEAYVEYRLDN